MNLTTLLSPTVSSSPYNDNASLSDPLSVTVESDQSEEAAYVASDLLYASATSNNTDASVDLQFNHKLSKINVTFTGNTDYAKGKTVTITNVATSTTIDLSDGTIGDATGSTSDVIAAVYGSDADVFTASAIIVPQDVSTFEVTIGKVTCKLRYTNFTFQEGYRYNFTATIPEDATDDVTTYTDLTFIGSITDWKDYVDDEYTFDLTAIDANLLSDDDENNSWDASTSTLTVSAYGQGGWYFADGLDLSSYRYLVLELGDGYVSGEDQLRLYSEDNVWGSSATFTITDNTVVIDLNNQDNQLSEGTAANTSSIYYVAFWAYDTNDIVINKMYATNNPPSDPCGTSTSSSGDDSSNDETTADEYTFNLSAIDANLLSDEDGDNSWDSANNTLTVAGYGQGGWKFEGGLDLSSYSYLILELGDDYMSGEDQLRLFSTDDVWGSSYAAFVITGNTVVIDLNNQGDQLSEGTAADMSSIYYVSFWAYDTNSFTIKNMYATKTLPDGYEVGGTN